MSVRRLKRSAADVDDFQVIRSRVFGCLIAALAAVVVLSGCNWKGDGGPVAAAIAQTASVKTRAFTGDVQMDMSKMQNGAGSGAAPQNVNMTFFGAIDSSNPASPKMHMTMTADGQTTSVVAPGDNKVYVTVEGSSYYTDIPAGQAQQRTVDPEKIYAALGDAVGHFQKAPPITNAAGKPVATTSATVSKKKLCGPVLTAFGDAMNDAGTMGGATGGALSLGGGKSLQSFCSVMLAGDPRVWFGIDNGALTDVELTAALNIPLAGQMGIQLQYHEYNQNQPQTGFDVPPNAQPMSALQQQLGATAAVGAGTI